MTQTGNIQQKPGVIQTRSQTDRLVIFLIRRCITGVIGEGVVFNRGRKKINFAKIKKESTQGGRLAYPAGSVLFRHGEAESYSILFLNGLVCRKALLRRRYFNGVNEKA